MPILENFIYNSRRNFIFAYVPKVACTNWKCILRYLDGHRDYLDNKLAHDRHNGGLAYLSATPGGNTLIADESIPKYTFIRNPYTRILSAYLNKVMPFVAGNQDSGRDPYFDGIFRRIDAFRKEQVAEAAMVNFEVFLKWLDISGDALTKNEHWIPQNEILSADKIPFSFMGRFERLEADAKTLLRLMECDLPFPTREAIKFPGTNAASLLDHYYTPATISLAQRIYAEDFRCLGYDMSEHLIRK